jgi:small subunit ribosomal protein S7
MIDYQHKVTCVLTQNGHKAKAERILRDSLALLHTDTVTAHHILADAIDNVTPLFELKRVRVSGMTHQIPALVSVQRQTSMAIRWLVQATRAEKRSTKGRKTPFANLFARQLLDASHMRGSAFLKKQGVHKIAEANRAFAHYRWW